MKFLQEISPDYMFFSMLKSTLARYYGEWAFNQKHEEDQIKRQLFKLRERRNALIEMRAAAEISKEEFEEMRDKLDARVAALKPRSNASPLSYDADAAVDLAESVMCRLGLSWKNMSMPLRVRLQRAVLPAQVTFYRQISVCKTAILSPVLRLNQTFLTSPSDFVAEVKRDQNRIVSDMEKIAAIARDDAGSFDGLDAESTTPPENPRPSGQPPRSREYESPP